MKEASASVLQRRIEQREAHIGVIGLGYAGLPLAVAFAEAGFDVIGVDLDADRVAELNKGNSYVRDITSERLRAVLDHLGASTDGEALAQADAIVISVPTPLNKTNEPDLSFVLSAVDGVAKHLRNGALVVLESTTFPGTTQDIVLPILAQADGPHREVGRDFFLGFSPERIDPGRADWTIRTTPRVISGVTDACLAVVQALYSTIVDTVVPVSSPAVAEMTKLFENTYRAVNIGLANEMALICDRLGINVWEMIGAAATKPFGFTPFYPGPGVGGHCIPVDPHYLSWKLRTLDYDARFIRLATEINFAMPHHVVGKVSDALNDQGKPVKGSRVLLLGVSYKENVSDTRESPALDIIALLAAKGANVRYIDPHVPRLNIDELTLMSDASMVDALNSADCVVIVTAHQAFDWEQVVQEATIIIDTRNALKGHSGAAQVVSI